MAQDLRHGTRTAPSFDDALLFTRLFPQSKSPQKPANVCELFDRLVDFMRAFSGLIQASQD
jgi:hypothetical protein